MKIMLTDEPFDAAEALRIGLVNEVVPHAQLMERAERYARHICKLPPVAVRMMKEFMIRFGDLPTDQAWHVQNLINSLLIQTTTDGEEGRQAFNAKRPPNFFVVVYNCDQRIRPRALSDAIHAITNYSPTRMSAIGLLGRPPAPLRLGLGNRATGAGPIPSCVPKRTSSANDSTLNFRITLAR